MSDEATVFRQRNFYGRRRGKTLRPTQVRHLEDLLPRLAVPGMDEDRPEPIDANALFGDSRPLWLEIGTGGGEHIAELAEAHPSIGLVGCEPFINGVAMLLGRIARQGIGNIRIHPGDARDLIDALPGGVLERVYLLYPDPWPKTRHAGRRFVNPANLTALARVMTSGAELRLATDISAYVAHALAAVADSRDFDIRTAEADRAVPWPGWTQTRYEAKALREGRTPHYLIFIRR